MSVSFDKSRKHWVVRWYETNPVTGERKHRSKRGFETKREAVRFEDSLNDSRTYMTFGQLSGLYLDSLKGYANEDSIERKRTLISRYCDSLYDIPVTAIKPEILQRWVNSVADLPFSVQHKNRILSTVKAVSSYGETYFEYRNFAKILKPFPVTSDDVRTIRAIAPDEFKQAMEQCAPEVYKRFLIFLYHTGMRRGEAKALLKADIQGNQCSISKSISQPKKPRQRLKNAQSKRIITLDRVAMEMIAPLMETEGEYLFGEHEPLPNTSIQRHFDEALKRANLPHYRIHDLRHSFMTNAILNGADIVTVSRYVGHGDIYQTLNTYSHLMKDSEKRLVQIIEQL